jgi:hypothetical protein
MKALFFIGILILSVSALECQAQVDTLQTNSLLSDLTSSTDQSVQLLPDHFLFTQRLLWGQKGLMRNFNYFQLSPEERQNELKIRRTMLATHQILGFATMGAMVAQGIVGAKLYNGDTGLKDTHEAIAAGVNFGYFTTASLALFAPPKLLDERKGYSSIKIHKALAIIHLSGMIATNILASQIESHPNLRPYHRAAAYTAFGAFAASMIIIKF